MLDSMRFEGQPPYHSKATEQGGGLVIELCHDAIRAAFRWNGAKIHRQLRVNSLIDYNQWTEIRNALMCILIVGHLPVSSSLQQFCRANAAISSSHLL